MYPRNSSMFPMEGDFYPPPNPILLSPTLNPLQTYSPILTPPVVPSALLPKLPFGPRDQSSLPGSLGATHVLSTHLVTAAWPRAPSRLFIESEHEPPENESKQDRKARAVREHEYLKAARKAFGSKDESVPRRKEVLYSAFNRYRRKGPWLQDGLTLVVTHAVGFPKEIWEPTYAKIVEQTEASGIVRVNEIWAYENPNHGDSAIINAGKLGVLAAWDDKSRDIIHFLLHYLPPIDSSASADLPSHLPRLPDDVAEVRRQRGFLSERTLVGLGHSAGATALLRAAIWEPKLFHCLILLEPMVIRVEVSETPLYVTWTEGAITRRSKWSSLTEAHNSYKASPSFSYWDPTVLETFLKYGIMEDKERGSDAVKLKGPVFLEGSTFSERVFPVETYEHLAALNKDIEIRFIYSGKSSAATAGEISTAHVAWRRPENTSNIKIPTSHLMVQESPIEVSKAIVHFLRHKYSPKGACL